MFMQPEVTQQEHLELQRLLQIIKDPRKLPGQRRIALSKFNQIYNSAAKRTEYQQKVQYV